MLPSHSPVAVVVKCQEEQFVQIAWVPDPLPLDGRMAKRVAGPLRSGLTKSLSLRPPSSVVHSAEVLWSNRWRSGLCELSKSAMESSSQPCEGVIKKWCRRRALDLRPKENMSATLCTFGNS
eukprot:4473684-Amphidinium_carterae.2